MDTTIELLLEQLCDHVAAKPVLAGSNLPQLALPSLRLTTQKAALDCLSLGESRIGGLPDVPPGFDWPRWATSKPRDDKFGQLWCPGAPAPLGFIAQIDLSAVPRLDDSLPNSGWLYFFYDRYCEPWGFDPTDRGCCRVLYAGCARSALERARPPSDADLEHVAQPCRVKAWAELSLPDDLQGIEYGGTVYEAYRELCEELTNAGGETHHHLLGYPQVVQSPMELECQLASNGVYCGDGEGYRSTQAKVLAKGAREWHLLLQIDTDEEGPGWMWGDMGRIYYWIKRKDLASLQFQNVWLIFQCF